MIVMSIAASKSTLTLLIWLMAAALGLSWAQDVPTNSKLTDVVPNPRDFYPDDDSSCLVPPQPTNGRWRLHRLFCDYDLDCEIPQGIKLRNGSRLVYNCESGYRVEGNADVFCTARGKWSSIPNCIQYNISPPLPPRCLLWGQSISTRDDYTYTPGVGRHKLHTRAVVWNEARKICEEEGGHLAIVNSIAEANAIAELFKNSEPITGSPHPNFASIGFHDHYSEGQFVTIHGQSLARAGFSQWLDGQPDNAGGAENCGSCHRTGRLNDINCGTKFGFICEMPTH